MENSRTCDHIVHGAHLEQQPLNESDLGARLQVADALAQYRGEHAPDFCLAGDLTVFQKLQHADDALGILNDEVYLQVKLSSNQLEREKHYK